MTSTPDRHSILADPANWASRTPLADKVAANRRALLGQLAELTEAIGVDGRPAAEGIGVDELAALRTAALRLAVAADAALTGQAQP